jgi:hypothetical protein
VKRLRAAAAWVRDHMLGLLGALVGVLVFVVTLGWARRRADGRAGAAEDRADVEETRRRVAELHVERARHEAIGEERTAEIEAIDRELAENADALRAKANEAQSATEAQLLHELEKAGY